MGMFGGVHYNNSSASFWSEVGFCVCYRVMNIMNMYIYEMCPICVHVVWERLPHITIVTMYLHRIGPTVADERGSKLKRTNCSISSCGDNWKILMGTITWTRETLWQTCYHSWPSVLLVQLDPMLGQLYLAIERISDRNREENAPPFHLNRIWFFKKGVFSNFEKIFNVISFSVFF